MSMARHKAAGGTPGEVYIVSNGHTHRLYSKLGAAKGVVTYDQNECKRYGRESDLRIYRARVDDWEEIPHIAPDKEAARARRTQRLIEQREKAELARLKEKYDA
jgi:hypothetical protein